MSRIPPASTRLSSGTLNYAFIGTSPYFFINQLKQNLALKHAVQLSQGLWLNPTSLTKKKRKPMLHPCLFPISSQLRAKKFFNLQFSQSQTWFIHKARAGAVGLVLSRIKTKGELKAGLAENFKAWAKPTTSLPCFKLNSLDAIKNTAISSGTTWPKSRVFKPKVQTQRSRYVAFGCLKKTKVGHVQRQIHQRLHGLTKVGAKPMETDLRLQKSAWLNATACANKQRQAYGSETKGKFGGFLQQSLQKWFKHDQPMRSYAYGAVNPRIKQKSVDFMLFCIVALVGTQPVQNALRRLSPKSLPTNNLAKPTVRYDCLSLSHFSLCLKKAKAYGETVSKTKRQIHAELNHGLSSNASTGLAGLDLVHYEHNAQSRDEEGALRGALRGFNTGFNSGSELSALKMHMHVTTNVSPKLSVARSFLNYAELHLFSFLEGRFAKGLKQNLQQQRKTQASGSYLPQLGAYDVSKGESHCKTTHNTWVMQSGTKPIVAKSQAKPPSSISITGLTNGVQWKPHKHAYAYNKALALACPSSGSLRAPYSAKAKPGLSRSKTRLVFKLDLHGHNKSFQLRPTLSIRL